MKHKDIEDMLKRLTNFYDWICKRLIPRPSPGESPKQPERPKCMLDLSGMSWEDRAAWRNLLIDVGVDVYSRLRTTTVYDEVILLTDEEFEVVRDRIKRLDILFRKHDLKDFPRDLLWNRKFEWFYEGKHELRPVDTDFVLSVRHLCGVSGLVAQPCPHLFSQKGGQPLQADNHPSGRRNASGNRDDTDAHSNELGQAQNL